MNLSSLDVGIFERQPERKRLRPTLFFPRHACAVRLEIMMDVNEIENQRKVSEFDRFISKFSINLERFC